MNASDLRGKGAAELEEMLHSLRKEQFNLRMQQGTGQMPRPSLMRQVRKDIARIKTVMNEQNTGKAS